ncbi:MAG: SIMPL domain-containing protein, partial [Pseudomonadota bacterium]|nr:SIMPL domain-containing protein [Pseudomonadota bacterium]
MPQDKCDTPLESQLRGIAMHKIWIALLLLSFPVLGLAKTLNQVNLQATASATTANDEMTVELAFDKQGPKISTLVDQSSRAIRSALARINHFPKIHVASGVYNTYPIYSTPPAGSAPSFQGWRLHQTLILHSSDFQAMQTLLGQLQPLLTLSWVHFGLAPTTRHHLTDSVTQSAIKAFRHRAL